MVRDKLTDTPIDASDIPADLTRWKRWLYPELARLPEKRERKVALKQAWRAQRAVVVVLSFPLTVVPWGLGLVAMLLVGQYQINRTGQFDATSAFIWLFVWVCVLQFLLIWLTLTLGLRKRIRGQLAALSVQVRCPGCGYDLQGHRTKAHGEDPVRCPECGCESRRQELDAGGRRS